MFEIGVMRFEDIPEVVRIERDSFAAPWTDLMFYIDLSSPDICRYFIALDDDKIVGYIGMHMMEGNAHVTTFAVLNEYRRRGIGTRLLGHLINEASNLGIANITLEVRISNVKARKLYKEFGFIETEIHEQYYIDNQEDAIILWAYGINEPEFKANIQSLLTEVDRRQTTDDAGIDKSGA